MLKRRVEEYRTELTQAERKGFLTDDQQSFLLPAIEEVCQGCKARVGSMDEDDLTSALYDGQDYLFYYLGQLQ